MDLVIGLLLSTAILIVVIYPLIFLLMINSKITWKNYIKALLYILKL